MNNFTLPKASPFFKHITLRFQLPPNHCSGTSHQIILLPLVQSTRRTLMQNSMPVKVPSTLCRFHFCTLSTSCAPSSCIRSPASLLLPPPGHLFSARHGITIGSSGEIARSRVHIRLSRSLAGLIAAADARGQCEEDLEDKKEDTSWWWEGEGDFMLRHVWDVQHYLCECTCFSLLCNC